MRWLAMVFAVGLLAAPARAADSTVSATRTIRLVSVTVNIRVVTDRAPKNVLSVGDVIRQESVLSNAVRQFGRARGAPVGSDAGTMRVVSVRTGAMALRVTVRLPGGTLRVAGTIRDGSAATIPVVGGTGSFANARGTCEIRTLRGNRALNVYRVRLP
jgi:hypothetical protein